MIRNSVLAFLFFASALKVKANDTEGARVLIHTLNYISHDYQFAVKEGKIISNDEYKEEIEFSGDVQKYFLQYSTSWKKEDSLNISKKVITLDSLIKHQADFSVVSTLAKQTINEVIAASGLKIIPSKYPNLQNGKIVFKTECAKCHGEFGMGDGAEGKELNPKPRNFQDDVRMKTISPFSAFNTIRLGIEGTGMRAHPSLDDEQVWDVAFYLISLRYQPFSGNAFLQQTETKSFLDSLPLNEIVASSDEELVKKIPGNDSAEKKLWLAAIRLQQPVSGSGKFIETSEKYLDAAMELYELQKYSEASQMAALSYLEGIEPIETQLKASDPELMSKLEQQMLHVRKMMEERHPLSEVNDSLNSVRATIKAANELLEHKNYSFWLALFLAASVLLREGLEAFLVIMVILSVLKATELKTKAAWVHAGWLIAVLSGVLLWLFGGSLMKQGMQHVELVEGTISFVAVGMLLYVGFWLHGKSEINRWKDYVNRMMKTAVNNKSLFGLASLSFFVVFREVFESVLFLSALNIESGGKQTDAIVMGVVAAFAIVIALAVLVLQFSAKLPIPKLFKISSLVMGVLAVVLSGKGVHSFQEIGLLPIHGLPVFKSDLLGVFPTVETCLAQLIVAAAVVLIWNLTVSAKKK
jgi:high-affinity iron transporter